MIKFDTDFVVWQPFADCEKRCEGCYVRASYHKEHRAFTHWTVLASLCNGTLKVNRELVLSVDTKSEYTRQEKTFLSMVLALPRVNPNIKLHLAVRNLPTFDKVMTEMVIGPDFENKNLVRVSVSEIQDDDWLNLPTNIIKYFWDFADDKKGAELNWNYLVDPSVPFAEHKEILSRYWAEADTIHLILKKPALGEQFDTESLQTYQRVLNFCREDLDINQVIYPDRCYIKHLDSTYCSQDCSHLDQIHIWPSGKITICPYDSLGVSSTWRNDLDFIQQFDYIDKDDPFGLHCQLNEWRNE